MEQKDFMSTKAHLQQNHNRLVNLLHLRHQFTDLGGYHLQRAILWIPACQGDKNTIHVFPLSYFSCYEFCLTNHSLPINRKHSRPTSISRPSRTETPPVCVMQWPDEYCRVGCSITSDLEAERMVKKKSVGHCGATSQNQMRDFQLPRFRRWWKIYFSSCVQLTICEYTIPPSSFIKT